MGKSLSRPILLALAIVALCAAMAAAEELVDVVYLKNGSVIRGMILEQVPDQSLKIRTADGSIFVFKMSEVDRIVKEGVAAGGSPKDGVAGKTMPPFSLSINPLGFAQFGPIIMGEVMIKPEVFLTPWLRFHALGVLSPIVASSESETVSIDITSLGLGIGAMRFMPSPDGLRGWHFGGALEYGWIDSLHAEGENWEWRVSNAQIAIVTNIGYRWRFPPMAFIVGGIAGAAYTFTSTWWYTKDYLGDSSIHTSKPSVFPFAMLQVAVVMEF
ncbi:MAG TPA: hypothetical protein VMV44_13300 [Rectinemataceae bacterium]|nr:hypothetical protein [Rectinemataceae bacterium]